MVILCKRAVLLYIRMLLHTDEILYCFHLKISKQAVLFRYHP